MRLSTPDRSIAFSALNQQIELIGKLHDILGEPIIAGVWHINQNFVKS